MLKRLYFRVMVTWSGNVEGKDEEEVKLRVINYLIRHPENLRVEAYFVEEDFIDLEK